MPDSNGAVDLAEHASEVKDGETISREDLENLMGGSAPQEPPQEAPRDLVAACAGGLKVNNIPATVELDDGRVFVAADFRAWGYCPYGVFAIGRFDNAPEDVEEYRVFNGDKVTSILLDWSAFEEEVKAQQAAATEDAEDEDGDAS